MKKIRKTELKVNVEKVFCDTPKDTVSTVGYIYEGAEDEPPTHRWRSLVKRYVDSEIAFHLTICEWPLGNSWEIGATEYGVLLYWPGFTPDLFMNLNCTGERRKRKLERLQQRACNMDRAMLVAVGQFFKMPQRTIVALPCAAFGYRKRLLSFDQLNSLLMNPFQKLGRSSLVKPCMCIKNGELVFAAPWGRVPIISDKQFPNNMIKGRPKIMNDFSDTNAPDGIGKFIDVDAGGENLRFTAEIDPWNIGFGVIPKEGVNISLQSIDLIPCTQTF